MQAALPVGVVLTGSKGRQAGFIVTGKVGHELRAERRRRKDTSTAIVFVDQLYPLPRR